MTGILFFVLSALQVAAMAADAEAAPESVCAVGGSCSSLIQSVQNTSKVEAHKLQEADQKHELKDNPSERLNVLTQVHEQLMAGSGSWGSMLAFTVLVVMLCLFMMACVLAFLESRSKSSDKGGASARQPLNPRNSADRMGPPRDPRGSRPVAHAPRPSSAPGTATSIPPSSYSTKAGAAPSALYLCGEELVVPDGSECNLVVPSLQDQSFRGGRVQMSICDTSGSGILSTEVLESADRGGIRLRLTSVGGDTVWASCRAGDSGGRKASMALHTKESRQPFAFMRMNPDKSFEAEACTGQVVRFEGSLSSQIRAKDSNGVLLGVSDKSRGGYSLRVGPLVDVGFMVTSLLAMDLMVLESNRR